jgi:hypothetical protein
VALVILARSGSFIHNGFDVPCDANSLAVSRRINSSSSLLCADSEDSSCSVGRPVRVRFLDFITEFFLVVTGVLADSCWNCEGSRTVDDFDRRGLKLRGRPFA